MGQTFAHVVKCSRCPSVEHVEVTLDEIRAMETATMVPALSVRLHGTDTAEFSSLCATCSDIVVRYIGLIAKKSEKKTALRKTSDKESSNE